MENSRNPKVPVNSLTLSKRSIAVRSNSPLITTSTKQKSTRSPIRGYLDGQKRVGNITMSGLKLSAKPKRKKSKKKSTTP